MQRIHVSYRLSIAIMTLGLIVLSGGCKAGGFSMPDMAFWKKDKSLWARSESVPPPATHFDPEPLIEEGVPESTQVAKEAPSAGSSQHPPTGAPDFESRDDLLNRPLRGPYEFEPETGIAEEDKDSFSPGGEMLKQLPEPASGLIADNSFGGGTFSPPGSPPSFDSPPARGQGSNGGGSFAPPGGFSPSPSSPPQNRLGIVVPPHSSAPPGSFPPPSGDLPPRPMTPIPSFGGDQPFAGTSPAPPSTTPPATSPYPDTGYGAFSAAPPTTGQVQGGLSPMTPPSSMQQPDQDLPPALRSADLKFAPGSVGSVTAPSDTMIR